MRAQRQAVFNGIGLHQVKQHLLQQMVFIRRFLPATSSARFSRSERYFAMALLAPRLERANTDAPAALGLVNHRREST
jgi:hypothetical protein